MAKTVSRVRSPRRRPLSPPARTTAPPIAAPMPSHRRLQVFSLDPAVDARLEDSLISRSVLPVMWEPLQPGPVGEYVEVVDVDPSSGCAYDPVDLTDPDLLAQDGLSPSAGNPQFHQQMVYAVAMKTIANFEQVLGRKVLWAERRVDEKGRFIRKPEDRYVRRLRIYPHALREQNAYYSPTKVALLFGYFNATTTDPADELPGGLVFTCLSHDIVAHETTHAILDGMHRRMLDPSNQDMIAFHEAFADIVAIFQHFTLPGLLLDQIQRTRGDLTTNSVLAQLAGQFARSTGQGDALRNALGTFDAQGQRARPDPTALARAVEPHERGAILVAAVFDAFVRMYESRVADLRRIATGGTGVLPRGDIHPDLARRFAEEAVTVSQRVLEMAIRAVDYLPPVDVTFGDFLRAIVTADADFFPEDPQRRRLAFIESFRDRGIYPLDVRALAEDALRWKQVDADVADLVRRILPPPAVLRTMAAAYDSTQITELLGNPEDGGEMKGEIWGYLRANDFDAATRRLLEAAWLRHADGGVRRQIALGDRYPRYLMGRMFASFLDGWIEQKANSRRFTEAQRQALGWNLGLDLRALKKRFSPAGHLEVHGVRPTLRLRQDGRLKVELLVVLTQRKRVAAMPAAGDNDSALPGSQPPAFWFRGGSTVIIDPEAGTVTYAVGKNILSEGRKQRQMAFLRDELARQGAAATARYGLLGGELLAVPRDTEPFAFAHSRSLERGTY